MCGICGFVGQGNQEDINRMVSALNHRGPDGRGTWNNGKSVYLGHSRLAIIDIECGHQPMVNQDQQVVISFNGEIYNFLELRRELETKGHKFKSDHSDTEVILNGYLEWGDKVVDKMNGMWAFAIYDSRKHLFFLSRDRFGEKPLFYSLQNNNFIFASELSSIEHLPHFDKKVSKLALAKYLAHGYIPSPNSILQNVYKLPAGCNLTYRIESQNIQQTKYWSFSLEPDLPKQQTEEYYCEGILDLLDRSVKARMVSDVPVGTFLSGGIDSTSITTLASKYRSSLETFSIGFHDESFDESQYSLGASKLIGTRHYYEVCSEARMLEISRQLINDLDEPFSDSSVIATLQLCKFARKRVKVALGGDGADELFAGYDPFKAIKTAAFFDKIGGRVLSKGLLKICDACIPVSHKNISLDFKIKRFLKGMKSPWCTRHPNWLAPFSIDEINESLGLKLSQEELYSEAVESWDLCQQDNLLDKSLNFYVNNYLQNGILTKLDRSSMLNSLEVRSPFLDLEFVDFVRKIPANLKLNKGVTKYILKKACSKMLPPKIINRPKKGFGVPVGEWFASKKIDFVPKFDLSKRLLAQHKSGKRDNRLALFAEYMLNKKFMV
jgi:asparagine synthase (glutamine-hydrolysing)